MDILPTLQNPKEEKMLHDEVDYVIDDDNNDNHRVPTVKDIPSLEYTERVFAESMRLYPPAWAIGRQAMNDCKIGDYVIPAGSSILMSQYLMHRDPRYFPEPDDLIQKDGIHKKKLNDQDLAIFHLEVVQGLV